MKADQQARAEVITKLYEQRHPPSSMGEANALVNAEYVCGSAPNKRLDDISL